MLSVGMSQLPCTWSDFRITKFLEVKNNVILHNMGPGRYTYFIELEYNLFLSKIPKDHQPLKVHAVPRLEYFIGKWDGIEVVMRKSGLTVL